MNEQLLKDFIATAQKYNYDWNTAISKFPELKGYDPQLLKDYVATAEKNNYNYEVVNAKFPEFGFSTELKKNDQLDSTESPSEDTPLASSSEAKPDGQNWLMNTASALDRGFYKNLIGNPVKGLGTLLEQGTSKVFGGSGKGPISDALIGFGDYFNKAIDELAPVDEEYKNSLSNQFADAFGQLTSMVLTGGVAGAAGKAAAGAELAQAAGKAGPVVATGKELFKEVANPVGLSAGLSMGQAEFDRAKEQGATDDQAFEAFYKNAVVGSVLEKVPVMQFMKRFNTASGGGIVNYLKTKGVAGLTGGAEEMTTEILQQIYSNKTAKDIYNTNQDLFEGVGSSGGVGFGVGFLLNAMGANAKILRKEGRTQEADVVEAQIKEFEQQAERGGPSSYKVNGIKINDKKVIDDMVENMSATDLAKLNIEIINDPELAAKFEDKVVTGTIKEQVRQANPNLNEKSLDAITDLEKQLRALEGNTTQAGKDKAAEIRSQIKEIQQNPLQEEVKTEANEEKFTSKGGNKVVNEKGEPLVVYRSTYNEDNLNDGINYFAEDAEYSKEIASIMNKNGKSSDYVEERPIRTIPVNISASRVYELPEGEEMNSNKIKSLIEKDPDFTNKYDAVKGVDLYSNNKIVYAVFDKSNIKELDSVNKKPKQDAVQKQAAGQVPVQSEAGVGEEVEQGVSQSEPQVTAQEGEAKAEEVVTGVELKDLSDEEKEALGEGDGLKKISFNGKGVGSMILETIDDEKNVVKSIFIKPEHRKKGIAKKAYIIAALKNGDVKSGEYRDDMSKTSFVSNEARKLWESLNKQFNIEKVEIQGGKFRYSLKKDAILEAYRKAKVEESNPELVETVEGVLSKSIYGDQLGNTKQEAIDEIIRRNSEKASQPKSDVNEILSLDTKDQTNLEKAYGFLDNIDNNLSRRLHRGANESMLAIPLGTMQVIVKALKILVKGGMTLQEAITKVAADNKVSFDDVVKGMQQFAETVSADTIEGYDAMMEAVDNKILDGLNTNTNQDAILSNVMKVVEDSDAYKNATDQQREQITRDVKEAFGEKIKKAPSAKRVLGQVQQSNKITSDEMSLLKKQFSDIAKGAKDAEKAIKEASVKLAADVKKMTERGKITAKQAAVILKKFAKVKVLNAESVSRFTDYMRKVLADADYDEKLNVANELRKSIKKASKSEKYDPHLTGLAKRFLEIDPSMVEKIGEYNQMASDIKEAIKGSSKKKFANTVEVASADAYITDMLAKQQEALTNIMRDEISDLLGIDGSTLTYDEMMAMMEDDQKKTSDQDEKIIRSAAIKLFEAHSTIIEHMLATGKDPFTGNDTNIKESKREVVRKFMDMDLRKMDIKDAIRAVDALKNFIVNGSTAKMEDTVEKYAGEQNAQKFEKTKIKGKAVKIYFSKWFGKLMMNYIATEPVLFDHIFGSEKRASAFEKAIGTSDLKSSKSKAHAIVNKVIHEYVSRFEKSRPNNQLFNTSFNTVERNMFADVLRHKPGEEERSFKNRKKIIEESIKVLKNGTEEQRHKGDVYEQVYNKILKDSNNFQEVRSKMDPANADAVDFWVNEWAKHYDELSDVSENVHNTLLGKDNFYTPYKYSSLGPEPGIQVEEEGPYNIMGSSFIQNSGDVYKKKTGRLMETTVEDKLPEGKYIDLSFDSNMSNMLLDALIDAKTAGVVRRINAFMKSDSYNNIIPDADTRQLVQRRIDLMVRNFRKKNHFNYDELAKASKQFNRVAALGAAAQLSNIFQPAKQVIPVTVNTMANTGHIPSFDIWWDKSKRDFIDNSGEAVALRGSESQTEFKAVDALLQKAAESTPEKALQIIEKVSKIYVQKFLQEPDVYAAKASWFAYYEKGLKDQGIDTKNIDYSTHKMNKEAAQYASRQIDRQQNISDADLKGELFSRRDGLSNIVSKVVFSFASFRLNQWLRANADLGTLTSKTSTIEEKKESARSLASFLSEVTTFTLLGKGISMLTYSAGVALLRNLTGSDLSDEDKEKLKKKDEEYVKNLLKGSGNSFVQDMLSPLPPTDPAFEWIVYNTVDQIQNFQDTPPKKRINMFRPKPVGDTFMKGFGTFGILGQRAVESSDIISALITGKHEQTSFGETSVKNIRDRDKDILVPLAALSVLNTAAILPSDFYTVQKTLFKEIIKQSSTKTEQEISDLAKKKEETKKKNLSDLKDVEDAIKKTTDEKIKAELLKEKKKIEDKINKPELSDQEKEDLKEQKKEDQEEYQKLLGGYDTRDDLKKHAPAIYEENFGKNSKYYKEHKDEEDARALLNKTKRENKDDKYNYDGSPKRKFGAKPFGTKKFGAK